MKKKFIAWMAAAALFIIQVPVYAAGSPTPLKGYTEVAKQAVDNIDMDGVKAYNSKGSVAVTLQPVDETTYILTDDSSEVTGAVEKELKAGRIALDVKDGQKVVSTVLGVVDVLIPDGTQTPVTVTIPVDNVKVGDQILVLHYNGSTWETIIPTGVYDKSITVKLDSFSPIVVVLAEAVDEEEVDDEEQEDDYEEDDDGDDSEVEDINKKTDHKKNHKKSDDGRKDVKARKNVRTPVKSAPVAVRTAKIVAPQTGDTYHLYVFGGMCVIAAAGLGVMGAGAYRRRRR